MIGTIGDMEPKYYSTAARRRWGLAIVFCVFIMASPAYAETVRLKNGNTLVGEVISQDDNQLEIDMPGVGSLTVPMSDVASVDKDEGSGPAFTHAVKLANGNVLYGHLDEQTAERVTVTIPQTGTVSFAAAEIASVEPLEAQQIQELEADAKAAAAASKKAAAKPQKRSSSAMGYRDDNDDMGFAGKQAAATRQAAMNQVAQAQQLVQRFQTGQSGAVPLPLAPSLAGGSSQAIPPELQPLMAMITRVMQVLGIWLFIGGIAVAIFYAVALQKLAERTGTENEWMAWIPLAHQYLALQVARKPGWWILLFFVPIIQILINIPIWMGIAEARGKNRWLGLLALLPIINLIMVAILAFGKDEEAKPATPGIAR